MKLIDRKKLSVNVLDEFIDKSSKVEKRCSEIKEKMKSFKSKLGTKGSFAYTMVFIEELQASVIVLEEEISQLKNEEVSLLAHLNSLLTGDFTKPKGRGAIIIK